MNPTPRRHFLKLLCAGAVVIPWLSVSGATLDKLRADRVGWVRLKTPTTWWQRHAEGDPYLMEFLRANTSLNLDPVWHQADCEDLGTMRAFPLIFTQEVASIRSSTGRANIGEFVRRGGFLLIDTCINPLNNPEPDATFRAQTAWLSETFPEARITPLPADHPVYRCHFQFPAGRPPHTIRDDARWTKHPLYGIYIGNRMAGVFTMSGLQCGWARERQPPEHRLACMRMLVNIYIYAMLHSG